LWFAAGMLWIMDASINVSMEPFRAFVGDNLPEKTYHGICHAKFFIGIGAYFISKLPLILPITEFKIQLRLGVIQIQLNTPLPRWNCIYCYRLWTVITSKEYSPKSWKLLKTQRNHFHKEEFSADWYMDTHT
jgi:maltose/moltooligosaccharide transporter